MRARSARCCSAEPPSRLLTDWTLICRPAGTRLFVGTSMGQLLVYRVTKTRDASGRYNIEIIVRTRGLQL